MQVVIVRQGNYNLIMDTAAISRSNIAAPYWEITYKTGSVYKLIKPIDFEYRINLIRTKK